MKKSQLFSVLLILACFFNSCSKEDTTTSLAFEKVTTTNLPKIAFHQSVVFDNKIWVIGGVTKNTSGQEVYTNEIYSSTDGVNFTNHGNGPFGKRGYHQVFVFNNKIWLIGGFNIAAGNTEIVYEDIWNSTDGINWTLVSSEGDLGPIASHKIVTLNNKLYCIGGIDASYNMGVEVWESTDGIDWNYLGDDVGLRTNHAAAIFNNKIYVIGGSGNTGSIGDCWSSIDGILWNQITPLPAGNNYGNVRQHEMISKNDKMYLIGGNLNNKVWETSNGIDWTSTLKIGPNEENLVGHQLVIFNDKIYVIGGLFDNNDYSSDIYKSNF
jgi:leucine-zipper-like transcriptional regulator 1